MLLPPAHSCDARLYTLVAATPTLALTQIMTIHDAALDMTAAGIANALSSAALNPSDVTKLRLQSPGGVTLYPGGLTDAVRTIVKTEGASALWLTGLTASMMREALYSTTRMGLYPHVKQSLGTSDSNLAGKIASGAMTGGLGSIISNPIDVVKVGLMAEAGALGKDGRYTSGLRAGSAPTWPSTLAGLRSVLGEGHGLRGASASVTRGMLMAASQLASYDHSKHVLRGARLMDDGPAMHVVCSQISAVCACLVTAPADIIKTRTMGLSLGGGGGGPLECAVGIVRHEGPLALWRGAFPSFLRLGPHFVVTFPLYEYLRKQLGLGYL